MISADVPNAPRKVMVEDLGRDHVTLVWEEPDYDGGSKVAGYYIEKRQGRSSRWIRLTKGVVTAPMFTVRDLIEDSEYEFRIVAENDAGESVPSETTGTIVPRDPFSKPSAPGIPVTQVDKERQGLALQWTKPKNDGRSPITNYIIEARPVGDARWKTLNIGERVRDLTFMTFDLEPDTDYEFRVSAENKMGVSEPSAVSAPAKIGKTS
jgi:titin